MRCSWNIEGHKSFHVFVKYLHHFGNYMWLINIEGPLGEVILDCTSYVILYFTRWSVHTLFLDAFSCIYQWRFICNLQCSIYVYDDGCNTEFIYSVWKKSISIELFEYHLEGNSIDVLLEPSTCCLYNTIDRLNQFQYIFIRIVFFNYFSIPSGIFLYIYYSSIAYKTLFNAYMMGSPLVY